MKTPLSILLVLFVCSCDTVEFSPERTRKLSINSTSAGATYDIKVGLPGNYSSSAQPYATIYVLDGEDSFDFVADKCNQISGELSVSNVVVVGIGYGNDRAFDYTPTKADEGQGGGEKFMLFIRNELIPTIESQFNVDTLRQNRVLLGHSFGGLLATYAFTNHNDLFGCHIILSPSLWYDNEVSLRFEQEHRAVNLARGQFVYLGLGELESDGRMLTPFIAFRQRLQEKYPGIKLKSHIEPGLYHRGSEKPNIIEGLQFYFENR